MKRNKQDARMVIRVDQTLAKQMKAFSVQNDIPMSEIFRAGARRVMSDGKINLTPLVGGVDNGNRNGQ